MKGLSSFFHSNPLLFVKTISYKHLLMNACRVFNSIRYICYFKFVNTLLKNEILFIRFLKHNDA